MAVASAGAAPKIGKMKSENETSSFGSAISDLERTIRSVPPKSPVSKNIFSEQGISWVEVAVIVSLVIGLAFVFFRSADSPIY